MNTFQYNSKGFTADDFDKFIELAKKSPPARLPPMVVGEFVKMLFDISVFHPLAKNKVSHWYHPKRTRKILAEGPIGRKESNLRVVVYRQSWTSETGTVQFIGPAPEHNLVSYPAKLFRYELYDGTRLVLQTNDLTQILNH